MSPSGRNCRPLAELHPAASVLSSDPADSFQKVKQSEGATWAGF